MISLLKSLLRLMQTMGIDPVRFVRTLASLPIYLANRVRYARMHDGVRFALRIAGTRPMTADRLEPAGRHGGHYFWQDLFMARKVRELGISRVMDVGSRVDGYITSLLADLHVDYVDVRPIAIADPHFTSHIGSITQLPFPDASQACVSSLHVIEHIGLGRYGDPVDPLGWEKALRELVRVLAQDGTLLIGTPIGRERLIFDAHRVFDPQTIIDACTSHGCRLVEFAAVDDGGDLRQDISPGEASQFNYGCGLFVFRKGPPTP